MCNTSRRRSAVRLCLRTSAVCVYWLLRVATLEAGRNSQIRWSTATSRQVCVRFVFWWHLSHHGILRDLEICGLINIQLSAFPISQVPKQVCFSIHLADKAAFQMSEYYTRRRREEGDKIRGGRRPSQKCAFGYIREAGQLGTFVQKFDEWHTSWICINLHTTELNVDDAVPSRST